MKIKNLSLATQGQVDHVVSLFSECVHVSSGWWQNSLQRWLDHKKLPFDLSSAYPWQLSVVRGWDAFNLQYYLVLEISPEEKSEIGIGVRARILASQLSANLSCLRQINEKCVKSLRRSFELAQAHSDLQSPLIFQSSSSAGVKESDGKFSATVKPKGGFCRGREICMTFLTFVLTELCSLHREQIAPYKKRRTEFPGHFRVLTWRTQTSLSSLANKRS